MADHLSIESVVSRLINGTIRIPGFQRKFRVDHFAHSAHLTQSFFRDDYDAFLRERSESLYKFEASLAGYEVGEEHSRTLEN